MAKKYYRFYLLFIISSIALITSRTNRNDRGHTILFLEIDQSSETGLIDRTIILERGDDCSCCSLEHFNSLQSVL